MKKRFMSTLLMGAFFIAATSMFVSCKDYDDDINSNTQRIQKVESALQDQITALKGALEQQKTEYTAANSNLQSAIDAAQKAADAAKADLTTAIADATSKHATKEEVKTADEKVVSDLNAAIATLKAELTTAINSGDAANSAETAAAKQALNEAIAEVNAKLGALNGDIAAATNAQTQIKEALTDAIKAVDAKVDTKAAQGAVDALTTALAELKQSAATKEAVQNAIDVTKGEIAKNIQAVQAAADKAQADATSAKADLATLAEKVATYAAAQAKAETKIEAIEAAIKSAQELEATLQKGIADNAADIKVINNQITNLDAQIKAVDTNLSKLVAANTNSIQELAGTVGNIGLQVAALEKFCGNLDALNVAGIRDSMRLSFTALAAAQEQAKKNLEAAEARALENAQAYATVLAAVLNARIDAVKDSAQDQAKAAMEQTKKYIADYVDALNLDALKDAVLANTDDISVINNTLTWSETGEAINLEKELKDLNEDAAANALALLGVAEWAGTIDEFVADVKANKAGFQTSADVDKLIEAALKDKDGVEKYVAANEINALLAKADMAETYKLAGVALTSDLSVYAKTSDLDAYLKKSDIDLSKVGASIGEAKAQQIAEQAITDASLATKQELVEAIEKYDAALVASLKQLFEAVKPVAEDAEGAEEANETAAEIIKKIAEAYAAEGGVSPAVVEQINLLKIQFSQTLTSLVFYPEYYYGGIESIEITALKIENVYNLKDKKGTANETFTETPQKTREFDLFPNGFAKYHINPVNADLTGYELAFIDHSAYTRSAADPYLVPVETDASKNYRDENDVLWVEFENNAEVYNAINNATRVPSMGHYSIENEDGCSVEVHYAYGMGKESGKGIVTALTATNEDAEGEASYVASDYALIVPVTINNLVIANSKISMYNLSYETSDIEAGFQENRETYNCNAAMKFHVHRKAIERVKDERDRTVNGLKYDEQFNLKDLVETHFVNSAIGGNADEKISDELFERLNLDYRFYPIDYTTDDITGENTTNYTSETKFMTLTEPDAETGQYFNGIGYFNQVKDNKATNGQKIEGENPFGGKYKLANKACVGRRPVVRVELYDKNNPSIIYAIGYLKLEITEEKEVEAESFDMVANSNKLFATCAVEINYTEVYDQYTWDIQRVSTDYMELRWDQIQAALNERMGGQGLTPSEWNLYEVVDGAQYFKNADGEFELISETYDADTYPWYNFGWLNKGEDRIPQGNHTDVLRWYFADCDYEALFFDIQSRYTEANKIIDKNTGKVQESITRYFKLISPNAANPVLYIGLTIPAGYIYYPAGTVGKVKGAYWKQAAKNTAGDNDIILNTDIVTDKANEATESQLVKNGQFMKELIKTFFGESITVDFNYGDLEGDDLKEAKERFSAFKDTYKDAPFYFRMPDINDANEKLVYTGKQWVVNGLSGNQYTLMVTDLEPYIYSEITTTDGSGMEPPESKIGYYNYGSSVSVIAVNGNRFGWNGLKEENLEKIAVDLGMLDEYRQPAQRENEDPIVYKARCQKKYDELLAQKVALLRQSVQKIQNGNYDLPYMWGYRIMTLDTKKGSNTFSKIELLTKLVTSTNDDIEDPEATFEMGAVSSNADYNAIVKGITQDMLNYKKHNSEGEVERPYNKQLTAFIGLYAINEAIYAMPTCEFDEYDYQRTSNQFDGHVLECCNNFKFSESDDSKPTAAIPCYMLPGYKQNDMLCNYCKPEKMENVILNTYTGCFRPFVVNKTFAVRFYDPVSIEAGEGAELTDADLSNNKWTIAYEKLVKFTDWANYTPSSKFKNFIKYYGISVNLPEAFFEDLSEEAKDLAIENGGVDPGKAPADPKAAKVTASNGTVYTYKDFTKETDYPKILAAAQAIVDGYSGPTTEPDAPAAEDAPVAPETGNPDAAENASKYAQVDAPKFTVRKVTTDGETTTVEDDALTGTEMKQSDISKIKQTVAPYKNIVDLMPYTKPTEDKTKNTKPVWTLKDGQYEIAWMTNSATKKTITVPEASKPSYDEALAGVDETNYDEKLSGWDNDGNELHKAYYSYFEKMEDLAEDLVYYAADALIYRYYVTDAAAYAAFFNGDPQVATKDEITKYFLSSGLQPDDKLTYYITEDVSVPVRNGIRLTTDPLKAKADPTTSIKAQNDEKKAQYDKDKALWDAYELELALYNQGSTTPYANYQKWQAAKEFIKVYKDNADEDYVAAKAAWDKLNNAWQSKLSEAMTQVSGSNVLAWKSLIHTDLGVVGPATARPTLKGDNIEAIEKLPTLAEAAPDDFVFEITETTAIEDKGSGNNGTQNFKGSFTAKYQNTNANTNLPFHLYVPLEVTYNYLNEKPAAPKIIYAVLKVKSTTGNQTTGARAKK